MSGRCSPTEALDLLHPAFEPMEAAAELTRAVHDNRCRIFCNGVVIKPHIAPRLMVVAHEADGRWTARIVGTFAMGGVSPTDVWEFEIDKVKALLPQPEPAKPWPTVSGSVNWTPPAMLVPATPPLEPPSSEIDRILDDLPRRPAGRLPEHEWRAIDGEVARRCIDPETGRVRIPKSERKLAGAMLDWCLDKYGKEPAESDMRAAVKTVCAALRPLQK